MPSEGHEAPIELFRTAPALVATLLHDGLGLRLHARCSLQVTSGDFTNLPQHRPDLAVSFVGARGNTVLVVVVELQLGVKRDKSFAWPLYAAALRARHHAPAVVLVVAPRASVARWARQPIDLEGGNVFRPLVIGP